MSLSKTGVFWMFRLAAAIGVCIGILLPLTTTADAQGRRADCEAYARDALRQNEVNERRNCGFKGPRWNDNRTAHFGWCMIFPRQASEEQEARQAQLLQCREERRSERQGRRANCDTYAKITVVQAEANRKYECGFRGGEWVREERPHFRWCMLAKRAYLADEIRYRAGELQKCFDKIGDDDEDYEDRGYKRRRFQ